MEVTSYIILCLCIRYATLLTTFNVVMKQHCKYYFCKTVFQMLGYSVIKCAPSLSESRDSSVGIGMGYELDDRSFTVRFPAGAGNFFLHHLV
jgi:hypothetical protein